MRAPRPTTITLAATVVLAWALSGAAWRAADSEALVRRGDARLEQGDAQAALGDFERAYARDARDARALNGAANALDELGRAGEALARRESVAVRAQRETWPPAGRAAALRAVALAAWRQDRVAETVVALVSLRALGASTLETDLVLGLAYLRAGDATSALALVPELRARYGDVEPVWKLALAAAAPGAGSEPRTTLEQFVGLRRVREDLSTQPLSGAGPSSGATGTHETPASDLAPASDVTRAVRAEALLASGDAAGAARIWVALATGPLATLADLGQARAALRMHDFAAALAHAARTAADPGVPRETVLWAQGQAFAAAGRLTVARDALRAALQANPLSDRSAELLASIGP